MHLTKMVKIKAKKFSVYDKRMKIVAICWTSVKRLEEILIAFLAIATDSFEVLFMCMTCRLLNYPETRLSARVFTIFV